MVTNVNVSQYIRFFFVAVSQNYVILGCLTVAQFRSSCHDLSMFHTCQLGLQFCQSSQILKVMKTNLKSINKKKHINPPIYPSTHLPKLLKKYKNTSFYLFIRSTHLSIHPPIYSTTQHFKSTKTHTKLSFYPPTHLTIYPSN